MKNKKRWLSLALAVVMAISSCTVAFTAFAGSADVERVREKLKTVTNVSTWSDVIAAEYKALSNEDKDAIGAETLLNYYRVAKSKFDNKDAIEAAIGFTPAMEAGAELGQMFYSRADNCLPVSYSYNGQQKSITMGDSINYITFTGNVGGYGAMKGYTPAEQMAVYEAVRAKWMSASPVVRAYADIQIYNTAPTASYLGTSFKQNAYISAIMMTLEYKYYGAKNPSLSFREKETYIKDFPMGPYINEYMCSLIALRDLQEELQVQKTIDFYTAMDSALLLLKQIEESPIVSFNNYTTMFEYYVIYSDGSSERRQGNVTDIQNRTIGQIRDLQVFNQYVSYIKGIEIPSEPSVEFNETIISVKKKFRELSNNGSIFRENWLGMYVPDAAEHYDKIQNMYMYVWDAEGSSHMHVEEEFEEVTVDYKMGRPYGDIIQNTLLPSLDSIVGQVLPGITVDGKGLQGIADKMLFNNANATRWLQFFMETVVPVVFEIVAPGQMGPVLEQMGGMNPSLSAYFLWQYGFGKQYGDVLDIMFPRDQIWNDFTPESIIYSSWEELPALDWGIADGDYLAFRDFFVSVISDGPIGSVFSMLSVLLADNISYNADSVPSVDHLGLYGQMIIPLLEVLGAENMMDSFNYSVGVNKAEGSQSLALKAALNPILDTLYYEIITPLLENPVEYLTSNLPNLIYHLKDGCIFDSLDELLGMLANGGLLPEETLDMISGILTFDGIWGLLEPMLAGAGINISYEDITAFAYLGQMEEAPTMQPQYETTLRVKANKDSVARQLAKIVEPIALDLLDKELGLSFTPGREFVKAEAPAYPHDGKMGKDVMLAMIKGFDGLIGNFVNIKDLINTNLCTEEMAATAITELYKLLGGVDLSAAGINLNLVISPKQVAAMMTEDKYREIAAALQVDSWENAALVIKNENTVIDQTDMGFKNGDRQGFMDCIVAAVRPLVKLLVDANLAVNWVDEEGVQRYGLYETLIIPVFEGIGLTPAVNSAGFTDNYNKLAMKADKNQAYDYLANTILAPVLGLLADFESAPLDTLLSLLPNLAYALQYSEDLAFIGNLLADDAGVIDLAGMLNGLIGGLLPGFELPPISLDALASCGTLTEKNSKSALHSTYTTVVADKADGFVTLFNYIYDTMNYKDNMENLKKMLAGIEGIDATLSGLLDSILNGIFTQSKEEALCMFGTLLASDLWECPDAVDGSNTGGKTPATGDNSIPVMAVIPVLLIAGAVIILLRRKKRTSV